MSKLKTLSFLTFLFLGNSIIQSFDFNTLKKQAKNYAKPAVAVVAVGLVALKTYFWYRDYKEAELKRKNTQGAINARRAVDADNARSGQEAADLLVAKDPKLAALVGLVPSVVQHPPATAIAAVPARVVSANADGAKSSAEKIESIFSRGIANAEATPVGGSIADAATHQPVVLANNDENFEQLRTEYSLLYDKLNKDQKRIIDSKYVQDMSLADLIALIKNNYKVT